MNGRIAADKFFIRLAGSLGEGWDGNGALLNHLEADAVRLRHGITKVLNYMRVPLDN